MAKPERYSASTRSLTVVEPRFRTLGEDFDAQTIASAPTKFAVVGDAVGRHIQLKTLWDCRLCRKFELGSVVRLIANYAGDFGSRHPLDDRGAFENPPSGFAPF